VEKLMRRSVTTKTGADLTSFGHTLLLKMAKEVTPETFGVTKREAERAARTIVSKAKPSTYATNAAIFAALAPAAGALSKGVGAATIAKSKRLPAAAKAFRKALFSKPEAVESAVRGGVVGAALTGIGHGRETLKAKETVKKYIEEGKGPGKTVLKKVL
jgi:hypothetical protein